MAKPGNTGLLRAIRAFDYSMKGIGAALRHESAFRQEAVLFVLLIPAAFWLGRNATDYAILIGSLFIVLIAELLNSAVEAVVDKVSDEHSQLAGRAKDMGSAAVFFALTNVIVMWALVAYERFC